MKQAANNVKDAVAGAAEKAQQLTGEGAERVEEHRDPDK